MALPFARWRFLGRVTVCSLKIDAEGSYEASLMADRTELRMECVPLHLWQHGMESRLITGDSVQLHCK